MQPLRHLHEPPVDVLAIDVDQVALIEVGPGCLRRDLPSREGVRIWVVDMAPGSTWPHVDQHGLHGEDVFVLRGTMIDGGRAFGPGSFLQFAPGSRHQPRTETGVRLFGLNLLEGTAP